MKSPHFEEIIKYNDDDDMTDMTRAWQIVEIILISLMAVLLGFCLYYETKFKQQTKQDREVMLVMITFVAQSIVAHVICFFVSVVVYGLLCVMRQTGTAYGILKYYVWLKNIIEVIVTVVCLILGLRLLYSGSLDNKPLHQTYFISMALLSIIFFSVRAAWFFIAVKPRVVEVVYGDKTYRVRDYGNSCKDEVVDLLAKCQHAKTVKNGEIINVSVDCLS